MRLKILAAGLVVALAAAACGGNSNTNAKGSGPELSKLTVYAVRDPQIAAQLAIADQQGMFKKHGLQVTARYFSSGSEVAPGFVSGDVQIGMASTMAMISTISSGFNAKLVGVVSEVAGGIGIVVKKGLGYDPKNLEGKKLGLIDAPPLRVMLANFAAKAKAEGWDFDLSKVKVVNFTDPATMVTALANGDIDAVAIWNPAFLNAAKFGHILFSGTTSYIPDGKAHPWDLFAVPIGVYTTPDFMKKYPRTLKAVLESLNDATKYIQNNPVDLSQVLAKLLQTPLSLTKEMVKQNTYTMKVDQPVIDRLRSQTTYLYKNKVLKNNPDPSSYVDLKPLTSVDPSLATAKVQ